MAKSTCKIFGLVMSLLLVVIGVAILVVFPQVYHNLIKQNIVLAYKNTGFKMWEAPPFPIYFQVWFWNVTNADAVITGAKPYVVQIGPYTYRETRNKENVTFHENDEIISYISPEVFEFVREKSVGDPMEDYITTINIPYLTVVNAANYSGAIEHFFLTVAAKKVKAKVYESYSVQDLLWGYTDPLLQYLDDMEPGLVPTTFFGLFVGKNNSYDGVYEVNSGKLDPAQTSTIQKFNGSTHLSFWTTNTTNMINGTDGTYYHPFIDKSEPIYVFSSDICRSILASYEQDLTVKGVHVYRYVGPPSLFQNHTVNPDNTGFCTPNQQHCLPGGLLNVSNCHQGAPVVMSLPHFLYSDSIVFDRIDGEINPEKEQHQTSFDLEPTTGAPVQVFKRLQINIDQRPYDFLDFKNLAQAYLPIVWLNESSVVSEDYGKQLSWLTYKVQNLVTVVQWVFIGVGIILAVLISICLIQSRLSKGLDLKTPINEKAPLLGSLGTH